MMDRELLFDIYHTSGRVTRGYVQTFAEDIAEAIREAKETITYVDKDVCGIEYVGEGR